MRGRMIKGILGDDSMSNLTCASNESLASPNIQSQSASNKKKRNLPGNPDPEAEVIALSPRSLLATNRFVCEVCNKGFQRDQNLQLHRRGHNLPWKLKQRNKQEVVKKKVYVCPEASCVHHHPSRALGDLTGIKKHFCRKHGEKKWKCEKCSKRYAVQSDWKAHSKICGTREYRCDCGTLFSRRDSFITHRAFCDALAEESTRAITAPNPLISSQQGPIGSSSTSHHLSLHNLQNFQLKQEQQCFNLRSPAPELPPWLDPSPNHPSNELSSQLFIQHENPNNPTSNNTDKILVATGGGGAAAHMSATALLQKAAQMGVTLSSNITPPINSSSSSTLFNRTRSHVSATSFFNFTTSTTSPSADLASRDHFLGNSATTFPMSGATNVTASGYMEQVHDMQMMQAGSTCGNGFNEGFSGVLDGKLPASGGGGGGATTRGGNEGLTRDFLSLTAFPHREFLNPTAAGFHHIMGSSSSSGFQQNQNQSPWQN